MRDQSKLVILVMSVCIGMMFWAANDALAQRAERPTTASPPSSVGVEAPGTVDPTIKVWTDKGDQGPTYYVGERIYISFTVQKDSYVTIYDVDSTGNVNILFPNPYHKDNLVRKGRVYTIPSDNYEYDLTIQGPAGDELLYAIASTHIYYHWQYCSECPPPIWSDQWGASSAWGHHGGPDSTQVSRRFEKRLQIQPQMADLTVEYMNHYIELARPLLVSKSQCRLYVTFPPY